MNYNTDGYNERSLYINNSNDFNNKNNATFDSSFAKMRVDEHRNKVNTVNTDKRYEKIEAKGARDNFILRNNNMRNNCIRPTFNSSAFNSKRGS